MHLSTAWKNTSQNNTCTKGTHQYVLFIVSQLSVVLVVYLY